MLLEPVCLIQALIELSHGQSYLLLSAAAILHFEPNAMHDAGCVSEALQQVLCTQMGWTVLHGLALQCLSGSLLSSFWDVLAPVLIFLWVSRMQC